MYSGVCVCVRVRGGGGVVDRLLGYIIFFDHSVCPRTKTKSINFHLTPHHLVQLGATATPPLLLRCSCMTSSLVAPLLGMSTVHAISLKMTTEV